MKLHKTIIILLLSLFLTACADNNSVPDSQIQFPVTNTSSSESDNSSEAEQTSDVGSIIIGNISLFIHESKQDIFTKLDEAGLNYKKYPDNSEEKLYDFFYNVDECLQIYFLNNECVRLRITNTIENSNELPHTVQGLYPGNECTYSQMITLYGDSFETHSYSGKLIYTIYRYSINDYIYEFGIQENTNYIYNIDIYLPSQSPIYDYGEEIQDSITIGHTFFSIYESEKDILTKLDRAGLNYSKRKPDNPEEKLYDFYYFVDDASLQIYFLNNECVRLRIIYGDGDFGDSNKIPHTVQGLFSGSTYSQMITLYGDSFETHSYSGKLIYTIYRYYINDYIYEFGIQEGTNYIYNIDIYLPSQSPIYDYGEEIQKTN